MPSVAFLSLSAARVKVLGCGEAETATGKVVRSASHTQSVKSVCNQSNHYFSLFNKCAEQFGIISTYNNPVRTVGFLSLTELRTPHGALNIVATPPAANEFEEVETEGGIQKARRVQTTNDWWLRVHRWRICVFFKFHTSLLFTIKGSVRWATAPRLEGGLNFSVRSSVKNRTASFESGVSEIQWNHPKLKTCCWGFGSEWKCNQGSCTC